MSTTSVQTIHVAGGAETFHGAALVLPNAWTKSGTDYWTIALHVVHAKKPGVAQDVVGVNLGKTLSLAAKSCAAKSVVPIYPSSTDDPLRGVKLAAGDAVVATITRVGSPASITGAVIRKRGRRSV